MKIVVTLLVIALIAVAGWFYFLGGMQQADENETGVPRNNARDFEPGQAQDPVPGVSVNVPEVPATTTQAATGTQEQASDNADAAASSQTSAEETQPQTRTFEITGRNFAFSQTELRVNVGDTVVINFSSTDGFHDWVIDEFDAQTDRVNTGESASVTFVADRAGEFEYYCSVGSHRELGMVGTLIVEE